MMWKKVLILLLVGLVHVSSSFPTEPSDEEVTESPTTTSSGSYSDAVVVEAVGDEDGGDGNAEDEAETGSGSDSDEAKEFDPNDCFLEKSRGPCRAVIDSWFFNVATKTCEPFMWSGCGGNNNRFRGRSQCEKECIKGTPPASRSNETQVSTTTTSAPTTTISTSTAAPTTASSSSSSSSDSSSSSSSSSSTTTTTTSPSTTSAPPKPKKIECPKFEGCSPKCIVVQEQSNHGCKKCQCPLPTDVDISTVKVTRSLTTSEVVVKSPAVGSVSGLPSTSTDDESKESVTEKPEEVCQLPPTRGHCRAMMTRYRYDPKAKDCIEFHFGGCEGNSNNFVTKEKCLEFCKGQ